jgi:hypothetical protein
MSDTVPHFLEAVIMAFVGGERVERVITRRPQHQLRLAALHRRHLAL